MSGDKGVMVRITRTYATVLRDSVDVRLPAMPDSNELPDVYERVFGEAVQHEGLAETGRAIPAGGARLAFENDHVSDDTGIDDIYEIEEIG